MSNYNTLKSAIADVVKQNGNNEITGELLQQALLSMINSLGVGYQFVGVATPSTNPGTPDQNVFYIASEVGTYANFDNLAVADNEVAIFKYNGTWAKETTGAATVAQLNQLGQKEDGDTFELVGLSGVPDHAGWIGSNNKFALTSGTCRLVPVKGGDIVTIPDSSVYFFVLKSYTDGDVNPDFATGYTIRQAGRAEPFTMPNDATLLAIGSNYNGHNRLPNTILINGKEVAQSLNDMLSVVNSFHICDSEAANSKSISIKGFTLKDGASFIIKFTNENTKNNASLNINGTGNITLYYNGAVASANNSWSAGDILVGFYYNGTYQLFNFGVDAATKGRIEELEDGNIETKEVVKGDLTEITPGYYITKDAQGNYTITASSSWESFLYKIEEGWSINGLATLYTNSGGMVAIAYLSGETVNSSNIISSVTFVGATAQQDFSISTIPDGAKYILFNSRSSSGTCSIELDLSRKHTVVEVYTELKGVSQKVDDIQPDDERVGIDCSKLLKYYYNSCYISSDGSLIDSLSWQAWRLPMDKDFELKCYSRSSAFYNVGFYSGEPGSDTFISGIKAGVYDSLATIQLSASDIPAGTKVLLFASRLASGDGTTAIYEATKEYDIRRDVDGLELNDAIGLPNLAGIYRGIPNKNDFIIIKDEIWFAINEYEGESATENTVIQRFKINEKGEISYISTLITDFGHWNSVDYNIHNDCLLFTNSANEETTVGNYFTIIKNPLALSGTISKANVGISYQVDMGYKVNAVWGESNLGKNNIIYCLSNNSGTLTKVMLEKDANGDFDGSFIVLETRATNLNKGIGGLAFWNDTIIIGVGVNYTLGFLNVTDLSYKEIQKHFYKDDGTEVTGSTQGVCIDDRHFWWFINRSRIAENYLIKINR